MGFPLYRDISPSGASYGGKPWVSLVSWGDQARAKASAALIRHEAVLLLEIGYRVRDRIVDESLLHAGRHAASHQE